MLRTVVLAATAAVAVLGGQPARADCVTVVCVGEQSCHQVANVCVGASDCSGAVAVCPGASCTGGLTVCPVVDPNQVFVDIVDPFVCPVFQALAPGVPGVAHITPDGDVYLFTKFWDCPPYA